MKVLDGEGAVSVGIFRTTPEGRLISASPTLAEMLGYDSPEDLMNSITDIGNQLYLDPRTPEQQLEKLERPGLLRNGEVQWHRRDGTAIWFSQDCHMVRDGNNDALYLEAVVWDITEHKMAEKALVECEERFRGAFETSAAGMVLHTFDGDYLKVNQAFRDMLGYSEEEFLGMNWRDVTHPDDVETTERFDEKFLAGEVDRNLLEKRYVAKDGSIVWAQVTTSFLRDDEGNLKDCIAQIFDITERKRTEKALGESEELFRSVFETSAAGMVLHTLDGVFIKANKAYCDMLGYSEEEILRMNWKDVTHPDDVETTARLDRRLLDGVIEDYHNEKRYVHKDGSIVWIGVVTICLRDGKGVPKYFFGQFIDITDRKRTEEALRESEARAIRSEHQLADAIESIVDGVLLFDADDRFVLCNSKYRQSYPEVEELLVPGTPYEVLISTLAERGCILQARGRVEEWVRERIELHRNPKDPILFQDQNDRWLLLHDYKTSDGGTFTIGTDITERKLIEQALRESEERYRKLVEESPDAILVHRDWKILYANPTAARILGAEDADGIVGLSIKDLIHSDFHELVESRIGTLHQGNGPLPLVEMRWLRLDGSTVEMETTTSLITIDGKPAFQTALRDITERKRTMKALSEAEEKYLRLFESSRDGIFQVSPEGRFINANPALARMLGYDSPRDLMIHVTDIGRQFYLDPMMRERLLSKLMKYGRYQNFEARARCKDGTTIWISENGHVVRNEENNRLYFEGTVKDITERKNIESAFRQARSNNDAQQASLFESMTRRECEIFSLLIKGKTNKVVADELGVSTRTVEFHRTNIKRKLNVATLAEMMSVYSDVASPS